MLFAPMRYLIFGFFVLGISGICRAQSEDDDTPANRERALREDALEQVLGGSPEIAFQRIAGDEDVYQKAYVSQFPYQNIAGMTPTLNAPIIRIEFAEGTLAVRLISQGAHPGSRNIPPSIIAVFWEKPASSESDKSEIILLGHYFFPDSHLFAIHFKMIWRSDIEKALGMNSTRLSGFKTLTEKTLTGQRGARKEFMKMWFMLFSLSPILITENIPYMAFDKEYWALQGRDVDAEVAEMRIARDSKILPKSKTSQVKKSKNKNAPDFWLGSLSMFGGLGTSAILSRLAIQDRFLMPAFAVSVLSPLLVSKIIEKSKWTAKKNSDARVVVSVAAGTALGVCSGLLLQLVH
jgi:hypothetical protein